MTEYERRTRINELNQRLLDATLTQDQRAELKAERNKLYNTDICAKRQVLR